MWILNFVLILYILMHTWLSGSVHLPIMLLILWGGSKWRRLGWLTGTKKRWVLVWGCYGLGKVIILATILWMRNSPEFLGGLDILGWEGWVVLDGMRALHIHSESYLVLFLLGFSLMAIVDAAIDSGLAIIVWWVYSLLTRKSPAHRRVSIIETFGLSLLLSVCAFGIANVVNFSRAPACFDCFQPDGIPFTFFQEGGFAGGAGFVWRGVIGDSLVILFVGFILGLVWNKLASGHSRLHPFRSQTQ